MVSYWFQVYNYGDGDSTIQTLLSAQSFMFFSLIFIFFISSV